jgi:hypothetical protein
VAADAKGPTEPPARLSRERVLRAAFTLAETEGVDALSIGLDLILDALEPLRTTT